MGRYLKSSAAVILINLFLTGIVYSQSFIDTSKTPKYKVESVINMNGKKSAGLNEGIVVTVSNLSAYFKSTYNQRTILFIDWLPIADCKIYAIDLNKNELRFFLERTDSAKDSWNTILGEPNSFTKHVTVSIGPAGGSPIACNKYNLELIIIRSWQFWVFVIYFLLLLLAIYLLFKKTNLLRDSFPPNLPEEMKKNFKTPYSLSRSQILFWTVIILISYVFIWLTSGDTNTITGSTLILLAISSATALGARVIDSSNSQANQPTNQNSQITATNQAPNTTQQIGQNLEPSTGKYWRDILGARSDDAIHRLQIIAWTVVFGIIFISSVWAYMEMPDFNASLLTLMGISSGTYIGFKYKE